ncbi:hypothetical protein AD953_09030 [Acetobacter malorum]|uniref:Uncharacterized protein n=2 Tax=Acetobacter malorum TaxID=178901 RepID=A0A149V4G4_9PROT|nr:hypothetical protein AD953_09030 [Acetobacter malorum]
MDTLMSPFEQKGVLVATYKKSQALYALWRTLNNPALLGERERPPAIFSRRFDKLLSVDIPLLPEERAGQAGQDNQFTADQVFLMAVALVIMDSGLGLGATGFFICTARESLKQRYHAIMERPMSWLPEKESSLEKDKRVYLLFQNKDIQEFYPEYDWSKVNGWSGKGRPPLIINPVYVSGLDDLKTYLDTCLQNGTHNHVLVIELAKMASVLTHYLEHAPIVTRGRHK